MNKVFLKGNVGKEPKITSFDNGGMVAQFTLATTERVYHKDSEPTEEVEWHNLIVRSSGLAGVVAKFVEKGTSVLVMGKLHTRKYTNSEGAERAITEIIVETLELCGGTKKDKSAQSDMSYDDLPI